VGNSFPDDRHWRLKLDWIGSSALTSGARDADFVVTGERARKKNGATELAEAPSVGYLTTGAAGEVKSNANPRKVRGHTGCTGNDSGLTTILAP
jgi:hypothetical protein